MCELEEFSAKKKTQKKPMWDKILIFRSEILETTGDGLLFFSQYPFRTKNMEFLGAIFRKLLEMLY